MTKNVKIAQIECLEVKTVMSEMKNIQDRNNDRLDFAEENISGIEYVTIETLQNQTQLDKKSEK